MIYAVVIDDPTVQQGLAYRASLANQTVEQFLALLATKVGEAVTLPNQPNSDTRIAEATQVVSKSPR